ncbi:hypothetical protein GQ55_2G307900 [Panicum hallii var. hallii]|uniref:Uncharacterized protein n=1 Tax=Panicum hallii var. hallii TaxID=1504633 RepID=A0A2T7EU70_9POAL|nr:hypothetical protein GQ55_2G307900 [Panicum hallii var. hallii]
MDGAGEESCLQIHAGHRFELLDAGINFLDNGFEVHTGAIELLDNGFDLHACEIELLACGFELLVRPNQWSSPARKAVSRGTLLLWSHRPVAALSLWPTVACSKYAPLPPQLLANGRDKHERSPLTFLERARPGSTRYIPGF